MTLHGVRALIFVLVSVSLAITLMHIVRIDRMTDEPRVYMRGTTTPKETGHEVLPTPQSNQAAGDNSIRKPTMDLEPMPYTLNTSKCFVPSFDPYDPSMARYFKAPLTTCDKTEKPFLFKTKVSQLGKTCPVFDYDAAKLHYPTVNFSSVECDYREVIRAESMPRPDNWFHMKRWISFKIGSDFCPPEENIWILCTDNAGFEVQQPLLLPKARPHRKRGRGKGSPFNVVVLGIDALSRVNFLRQLPKTRKWLENHYGAMEMFGYNKIAENSAPNQIPLLTGVSYIPGLMDQAIGKHFDNLTDYIWDHYKNNGFTTMFFEEQLSTGLFVFPSMQGFLRTPTDYYPRPLMHLIDSSPYKMNGKGKGRGICIGGEYAEKYYLQYVEDALEVARGTNPLFSYAWFSELSHDQLNGAQRQDDDFVEFFERISKKGLLDETVILFVADHGNRLEEWRGTVMGRYEDMLPFFYAIVPPKLISMRPDVLEKLRVNSRRLVTVYDIHATLLELMTPFAPDRKTKQGLGVSLISHEIPETRTCLQAGINLQFCSCLRPVRLPSKFPLARKFAMFVINAVNEEIAKNNATSRCEHWKFKEVQDIFELEDPDKEFQIYRILLVANPHKAVFEAAAIYRNNTFTLQSRIERLDWYSVNANCVKDKYYARYCYCK